MPTPSARVDIQISPLSMPGVAEVCYQLEVFNGPPGAPGSETVWANANVCSGRYGNGGGGDVSYVGPCDASALGHNYVELTLRTIEVDGGGSLPGSLLDDQLTTEDGDADFDNPCPTGAPCTLDFACVENADTAVVFNLVVMRDAEQGFFDFAVNFEDVFCSAKLDCADADGGPLLLLHDPLTGQRTPSVVMALFCTAGPASDTHLYYGDVTLTCGGVSQPLAIGEPEAGNVYSLDAPAPAPLRQLATYRGSELLSQPGSGEPLGGVYYNIAFALDFAAASAGCNLSATAIASDGPLDPPFTSPPDTYYPIIRYEVPLVAPGGTQYACGRAALDAGSTPGEGVFTSYTSPAESARFVVAMRERQAGCGAVLVAPSCQGEACLEPLIHDVVASTGGKTGQEWCAGFRALGTTWDCIDVSNAMSCSDLIQGVDLGVTVRCREQGPGDRIVNVAQNSAPGRTGRWWCSMHFGNNLGGLWDCVDVQSGGCDATVPNGEDVLCRKRDDEVWIGPTHISASGPILQDFRQAFEPNAPWAATRARTTTFKTYPTTLAALQLEGPADFFQSKMAPQLRKWRMGLGIEVAGATCGTCNPDRSAILAQEQALITYLRSQCVPVEALVLDSPLFAFVVGQDVNPMPNYTMDKAIADIVRYVRQMRLAFPDIRIGITDPVPQRLRSPGTFASDFATLKALYWQLTDALAAEGLGVDFFQLDHPNNYLQIRGFSDWTHLVQVEDFIRYELGNRPQIVFNDSWGGGQVNDPGAGSSAGFRLGTLTMAQAYLADHGRPQGYVVQSWFHFPDSILDEATAGTHAETTLQLTNIMASFPPAP